MRILAVTDDSKFVRDLIYTIDADVRSWSLSSFKWDRSSLAVVTFGCRVTK